MTGWPSTIGFGRVHTTYDRPRYYFNIKWLYPIKKSHHTIKGMICSAGGETFFVCVIVPQQLSLYQVPNDWSSIFTLRDNVDYGHQFRLIRLNLQRFISIHKSDYIDDESMTRCKLYVSLLFYQSKWGERAKVVNNCLASIRTAFRPHRVNAYGYNKHNKGILYLVCAKSGGKRNGRFFRNDKLRDQ